MEMLQEKIGQQEAHIKHLKALHSLNHSEVILFLSYIFVLSVLALSDVLYQSTKYVPSFKQS